MDEISAISAYILNKPLLFRSDRADPFLIPRKHMLLFHLSNFLVL